jgi:hypothetical protein
LASNKEEKQINGFRKPIAEPEPVFAPLVSIGFRQKLAETARRRVHRR